MIETLLAKFAPIAAAVLMMFTATGPTSAQFEQFEDGGACLSNRDLQSAIASGEIPPVSDVLQAEGVDPDDVLSVKLCEGGGGGLAYFVGVLGRSGEASTLVLPATGDRP